MADYKSIHGVKVQTFTADPDNPIEGQIWYDDTAKTIQYQIPNKNAAGIWRTGNTSPYTALGMGGVGSQTAALIFGGEGPPGAEVNTAVSYNGTTFTGVNNMNEQRQISQNFGTSTSAIAAGGELNRGPPGVLGYTESWDGTNWTETTDINTARRTGGGSGSSSTSGIIFGGGEHPSYNANTESWNGSAWTEVGDLPTGQGGSSAGDSATAALMFGGPINPSPPYISDVTVAYNGSTWTAVNSLNTSRRIGPRGSSVGANSNGGAFYAGGLTPGGAQSVTETWNGTSWTEEGDLSTARYHTGAAGSSTAGLVTMGADPSGTNVTEEFAGAGANDTKEFDLS